MAYFKINGHELDLADATVNWEPIGAQLRTQSGKVAASIIRNNWQADITLQFADATTAKAVATLLRGEGEVWSFDDVNYYGYGSKGSGTIVGSSLGRGTTTPDPVFGVAYGMINSGLWVEFDIALNSTIGWTVLFWHNPTQTAAGTWTHYAVTSTGRHYTNGNYTPLAAQHLLTTTNSRPRLNGKNAAGTNTASSYDHLVVVPCVLTDQMISSFSSNTLAFGSLPKFTITGDLVTDTYGSTVSAIGDVGSIQIQSVNYEGDVYYKVRAKLTAE